MVRQVFFCIALLTHFVMADAVAQPTQSVQAASTPRSTCGAAPTCSEPPKCEAREIPDQRDTRSCQRTLVFGLKFNDPACEANKASVNQKIEFSRAVAQQEYRQCLVSQESHRVGCEVRLSEWENCITKELPQFPPRTLTDRKYLYSRCTRAGGKDEFTDDCCTHLYVADRSAMGVCQNRSQPRK